MNVEPFSSSFCGTDKLLANSWISMDKPVPSWGEEGEAEATPFEFVGNGLHNIIENRIMATANSNFPRLNDHTSTELSHVVSSLD